MMIPNVKCSRCRVYRVGTLLRTISTLHTWRGYIYQYVLSQCNHSVLALKGVGGGGGKQGRRDESGE